MDLVNNSNFGKYFLHGQAKQGIQQGQDACHKSMFVEFGLVGRCHRHIEQVRGQYIHDAYHLRRPPAPARSGVPLFALIFYVAAVGALAILFLLIRHRINNGGDDDRLGLGPRQAQSYAQAAAAVPMLAGERAMLVPYLVQRGLDVGPVSILRGGVFCHV